MKDLGIISFIAIILLILSPITVSEDVSIDWSTDPDSRQMLSASFGDIITLTWSSRSIALAEVTEQVYSQCLMDAFALNATTLEAGTIRTISNPSNNGLIHIGIVDLSSSSRYFISTLSGSCDALNLQIDTNPVGGVASDRAMPLPKMLTPDSLDHGHAVGKHGKNIYVQAPGGDVVFLPTGLSASAIKESLEQFQTRMYSLISSTLLSNKFKMKKMRDELEDLIKISKDEAIDAAAQHLESKINEIVNQAVAKAIQDIQPLIDEAEQDAVNTAAQDVTDRLEPIEDEIEAIEDYGVSLSKYVNSSVVEDVEALKLTTEDLEEDVEGLTEKTQVLEEGVFKRPRTCRELFENNDLGLFYPTKEYIIYPDGETATRAWCEMSEFDPILDHSPEMNLARGKPTSQSSEGSGGHSSRAVDGNKSPIWQANSCTHTAGEGGTVRPWWRVDLGSLYYVEKISITNRGDCCGERFNRAKIILSRTIDDASNDLDPMCTPGVLYSIPQGQTRPITCTNLVPARYVTVRLELKGILTMCEVEIFGSPADEYKSGWTVIASQASGLMTDGLRSMYKPPMTVNVSPNPARTGVLEYFMKNDLKKLGDELYVINSRGESKHFRLSDFSGPLVIDGPNFVDAYDSNWRGIIAGNNSPVLTDFQIANACDTDDCHKSVGSNDGYSKDVMIVLDWHNGDGAKTVAQHAHFGGKSNIETGWSARGLILMIR